MLGTFQQRKEPNAYGNNWSFTFCFIGCSYHRAFKLSVLMKNNSYSHVFFNEHHHVIDCITH